MVLKLLMKMWSSTFVSHLVFTPKGFLKNDQYFKSGDAILKFETVNAKHSESTFTKYFIKKVTKKKSGTLQGVYRGEGLVCIMTWLLVVFLAPFPESVELRISSNKIHTHVNHMHQRNH